MFLCPTRILRSSPQEVGKSPSLFFISHHLCADLFFQSWQMTLCLSGHWDWKLGFCYIKLTLVSYLTEYEEARILRLLLLHFPRSECDRKCYFKAIPWSMYLLTEGIGLKEKRKTMSILKKLGAARLLNRQVIAKDISSSFTGSFINLLCFLRVFCPVGHYPVG